MSEREGSLLGLPGRLAQRVGLLAAQTKSTLEAARANFFWSASQRESVPARLQAWAAEAPEDPFLVFEGESWSVGRFDAAVNRHARAWSAQGIHRGDAVALVLDNHPLYLVHSYALMKLGAVASLINPALRGPALAHALEASSARAVVVDANSRPGLEALRDEGHTLPPLWDVQTGPAPFEAMAREHSPAPIPHAEHLRLGELAAYIFTSGTTGLPKPALVKHHRLWRGGVVFGGLIQMTAADALYCCLPLYHANASLIATPAAITHRARLVLARRFSARRFWDECSETGATCFIYVGELVRYLLNQRPHAAERSHTVTKILGNGLAADLWPQLEPRFGITRVAEYYAATEGNAETLNLFNREASMGPLLPWKMAVVAWDAESQDIVRDARGRAQRVKAGEPGLLVGKISERNDYAGYADPRASQKKVLRDLFKAGDAWFDTGDLVAHDRLLHLRFVDRLGDTFRWKSENVSTREVEAALGRFAKLREACVYGVEVPGHEGRAGMAAVVVEGEFDARDGAALFTHLEGELPRYALPRFVRLVDSLEVTGTFKHRKQELKREGWREVGEDPLWMWDGEAGTYQRQSPPSREQLERL